MQLLESYRWQLQKRQRKHISVAFCIGIKVDQGLVALADTQIFLGSERIGKQELAALSRFSNKQASVGKQQSTGQSQRSRVDCVKVATLTRSKDCISTMTRGESSKLLSINGGSSSIKFALFEAGDTLQRSCSGSISQIGLTGSTFEVTDSDGVDRFATPVDAPNHTAAVNLLMTWLTQEFDEHSLAAVGHRIVHGGPKYHEPQRIDAEMIRELHRFSPFDPEHLPRELELIEAIGKQFPKLPQVACFDTHFHHNLPRVARVLPIPRRYESQGVRRYGFHGLSYEFLMQELDRIAGTEAARGRVVLAHLGNGASLAAVRDGKSIDTTMSFTPTAGVPMSTRSGDLDPSLCGYFARSENMTADQFNQMVNTKSGLLGISETSSDIRDLLERESQDVRAAEAVAIFCYEVKKRIGSFAAALGGLDTLVFSGGIGENSPQVRSRVCERMRFLGIELDESRNANAEAIISTDASSATVRVIRTDEEMTIARSVYRIVKTQN